ncbi:condensin complex subunit 2-like [Tubulanus polymorphus]|uniref:condensin complex subunit 2-like n=1 Tax=Tubulanus polymorphus TaxID=672921 RepID=UPI003DA1D6AE
MAADSVFKTPTGGGSVSHVQTVTPRQDYVSPSTRRHVSVFTGGGSGSMSSPTSVARENDDIAEKKARRRSKVLELQRMHLSSPGSSPTDRSRTAPLHGLSNAQLSEHYTNCIKLSAENKINAKNAFGLHLIDYMADLIKKKEMSNFQVASSTLDASAKIYAGRVDAIHSDTYKMLGGLGQKDSNNAEDGGNEVDNQEDCSQQVAKKQKRFRRSGKTVETNLKNIKVKKFDLEFEVDPLFHQMASTFDEGGTTGLLLNHLYTVDNSSQLQLDSNAVVMATTHRTINEHEKVLDISTESSQFRGRDFEDVQVCPAFADFTFTNWDKNCLGSSSVLFGKTDSHAFDMEAEPEPIPNDPHQYQPTHEGYTDDEDYGAADDRGDEVFGESDEIRCDSQEARMVNSVVSNIKSGTVGELIQVLSTQPSEYSYFNSSLLTTWAGPSHWKVKGQTKDVSKEKKPKTKKAAFKIDYDSEAVDFEVYFKKTRAATTVNKATLNKYSSTMLTLPDDLHYDPCELFRLFGKPKVLIRRQTYNSTEDLDASVADYDYDNANDRDNFCPADTAAVEDDDDDAGGFDFTAGGEFSQMSDLSQQTADNFLGDDVGGAGEGSSMLTGDNLLEQPKKVSKIDIAYAKAAKKMDVKKLKHSMWNVLMVPPEGDKVQENDETPQTPRLNDSVNGTHTFSELVDVLPNKVSKNMAKNLSVPIAFVCLLHLANEKNLVLKPSEDMSDFTITQGI